ncbi:TPA: fimbria/pilus outer membrane usher protein [Enterobacter asburiae]
MKLNPYFLTFLICVNGMTTVLAKDYEFDASQIGNTNNGIDISIFNNGGQLPGTYSVDIYVNKKYSIQKDIYFYNVYDLNGKPVLTPCLTRELLLNLDILVDNYPEAAEIKPENENRFCTVPEAIPQAQVDFSLAAQELYISVPQVAMQKKIYGIASQDKWDDGISAFRLNYDINGAKTTFSSGEQKSRDELWSTLQPGLNYGSWRVRNITGFSKRSSEAAVWQRGITYASTALRPIKSTLTAGESFTQSDIFEPFMIRGIILNTDEGMYPANMRAFSPVVKGIARTQAKVTVTSNGIAIFNDMVPPGPFILDSLPLFTQQGELLVTIDEADGQRQTFTVPWQAPAIAVPDGYFRYSISAGEYQAGGFKASNTQVFQSTAVYGLNDRITLYGGYQRASDFYAILSGAGASLGSLGSTSLDYSHSASTFSDQASWEIWRFRYSSQIESSGTGLQLESRRYMSPGIQTLPMVIQSAGRKAEERNGPRTQYSVALSQSASQYGSLYINASHQGNYDGSKNQNLGGGYSLSLPGTGTLMLDWYEQNTTHTRSEKMKERIISLMLNFPLERITAAPINMSYRRTAFRNNITQDFALNGASSDQSFFWNAGHSTENSSASENIKTSSVQLMLDTRSAQLGAWYSSNNNWQTAGTGISGGLLVHHKGITAGPSLGETVTLVDAKGADNVSIFNTSNIVTDSRGYALIPSVAPYQTTNISLDPSTLAENFEIGHTDATVTPTRGAIIPATFSVVTGNQAVFSLKLKNEHPVPFGAVASLAEGDSMGIIDEFGRLFMAGLPDAGTINIKWGKEYCSINFNLSEKNKESAFHMLSTVCA